MFNQPFIRTTSCFMRGTLTFFKHFSGKLFSILGSTYSLAFTNGLLLTLLFFLSIQNNYKSSLYAALVENINNDIVARTNEDTFLLRSLLVTNALHSNRNLFLQTDDRSDISVAFTDNSLDDLITARGACGSASAILLRILQKNNYEARIGQMKVNGKFGGHIIIEARKNGNWVVLDPQYNLCFKNPKGGLASFADVKKDFNFYAKQVPANYPVSFRFEDIRYTNWNKVPLAGALVKSALILVLGKKSTDEICIRASLEKHNMFKLHLVILFTVLVGALNIRIALGRKSVKQMAGKFFYLPHLLLPQAKAS